MIKILSRFYITNYYTGGILTLANLSTVSEVTTLFETYFPSGLNYNSSLTQITGPRSLPVGETNAMRLAEQLQFLGAFHNKVPDTNTARQSRIKTEIETLISILQSEGYMTGDKLPNSNFLNESFLIMGLSIIKSGTAYAKLSSTNQTRVNNGLTALVAKAKSILADYYLPGGLWGNRVPTTYSEYQTGNSIKVPLMSINSTAILIGALGMYENLVAKSSASSTHLINYSEALLGFENKINNGGYFVIGGGLTAPRRLFGSTGYNSVVGQALLLAYRGLSLKKFTVTPVSTNKYQAAGERIASYYENLIDTTNIRLDEFHNSNGVPVTQAIFDGALATVNTANFTPNLDPDTAQVRYDEAIALISPAHRQSSVYLYSLAWGAPQSFFAKLDKHIVKTGEANPNLPGVSAMRAAMNAPGPTNSHNATSGRVLTGFAALMMRGIVIVTDGH